MPRERLSMRNIREVLRQKWVLGQPHRAVAQSLRLGMGTVTAILQKAASTALTWPEAAALDDAALELRVYGLATTPAAAKVLPDPVYVHTERAKPGVTLTLLHQEYLEQHPGGYQFTQYCEYYSRWLGAHRLPMRQDHRAGDKLNVDYSGVKPVYVDLATGEIREAELFVGVLAASNLTYAEATATQGSEDFIASHVRMFAWLGGVPGALVPDQLKSAVTGASRYEPLVQRTYAELARHYGCCVVPARPGHPRDKAKVEVGVQVAQRWIVARLRHETIFGLAALNARIATLLTVLNGKVMRLYGVSRRALFERIERGVLKALPDQAFEHATWKAARVNLDYHVEVDHHYYSAPHALVHEAVEVRVSASSIELFCRSQRVAVHVRSLVRGHHTTAPEHMPKAHAKHLEWTPTRILDWAGSVGPQTRALAEAILMERPHPEQGYRSCLGILRLGKQYGAERLEAACGRAYAVGARSYRHVAAMLQHGLDRMPVRDEEPARVDGPAHEHVRGAAYYFTDTGGTDVA
jgi:transposase